MARTPSHPEHPLPHPTGGPTYDPACYDLAQTILTENTLTSAWADKAAIHRLALEIQQCIEDFIANETPPEAA